jgi:glucose-6-phosphate isomerase
MIQLTQSNLEISKSLKAYDVTNAYETLLKRSDLGFLQLPNRQYIWDESKRKGQNLKHSFDKLIVLGIGGSSLGPQTILKALATNSSVEVWDTVDPIEVDHLWSKLTDISKVHFLAISKSGNTMETLGLINFVSAKLAKLNIKLPKHFSVITTCNQNPLHNWAIRHGLDVTDFPKDVGGRFSVLTSVGLIPAVFAGVNIDEMQEGARWTLSQPDLIKRLTTLTLESFIQEKWITVFWAYPDALSLMGDWVRQLWAESIAKAQDRKGNKGPRVSTPFLCQGTKDHLVFKI